MMNNIILLRGKFHDRCVCFVDSSPSGAQMLTYRYEKDNGELDFHCERNQAGEWVDTVEIRRLAQVYFKEIWGQ